MSFEPGWILALISTETTRTVLAVHAVRVVLLNTV